MPEVSVVIPAYNREKYIAEAIESVLAQESSFPFEVIVSDDGSSDRTVQIAQSFGDRVRVLTRNSNRGAAAARNAAIKAARAPLIAFLDSDDVMLRGRLMTQVSFLNGNPEVGVVSAACIHESGDSPEEYFSRRGLPGIPPCEWLVLDNPRPHVAKGFFANSSTATVRKHLIEEVGYYNERYGTLEDWDLLFRLASVTKFACYNAPLAWIRTSHPARLGRSSRGAMRAPEVWWSLLNSTADLSPSERKSLEGQYNRAIRGALSAAMFSSGGSEMRTVLRSHGSGLGPPGRAKWLMLSLLPKSAVVVLLRGLNRH